MALFLKNGYLGTSMDQIAARAGVSKQTIYTHFADKESLFRELVAGTAKRAEEFVGAMASSLQVVNDLEKTLRDIAQRYVATVFRTQVLQLRRLVMMEARRFPVLARSYYEQVSARTIAALSSSIEDLAGRGLLSVADPSLAAKQLAALLVMVPLDRAMFVGDPDPAELDGLAKEGVRVFLSAYRNRGRVTAQ